MFNCIRCKHQAICILKEQTMELQDELGELCIKYEGLFKGTIDINCDFYMEDKPITRSPLIDNKVDSLDWHECYADLIHASSQEVDLCIKAERESENEDFISTVEDLEKGYKEIDNIAKKEEMKKLQEAKAHHAEASIRPFNGMQVEMQLGKYLSRKQKIQVNKKNCR